MIESYLQFQPVIDPGAFVHESALIAGDVEIGPGASIWPCSVLRGDQGSIHIGADSNIQDGAILHGTGGVSTTTVGARVTVGHRAILHGCLVEDDSLIGMGAIVMDNAVIGSGSLVAAGAVVIPGTIIPPGSLVLGTPARAVRPLSPEQAVAIEHGWKTYRRLAGEERVQLDTDGGVG